MKYVVIYDEIKNEVFVRDARPGLYVDAEYDYDYALYRAWVEADNKEQAIRKALIMFIDVADNRVKECMSSFDKVKNKLIEVMR